MVRGAIVTNVMRFLAVAALAGAFWLDLGVHADACSCAQQGGAQQAARADVVFRGTVTVIEPPITGLVISSADPISIRFAVDAVYKGMATRTFWVSTERSDASCGFEFLVGRQYTVFARVSGDRVQTDICSGTLRGGLDPASAGSARGTRAARGSAVDRTHRRHPRRARDHGRRRPRRSLPRTEDERPVELTEL